MKTISVLTGVLLAVHTIRCTPCSRLESLNITSGVEYSNGSVIYDEVEYAKENWYEVEEEGVTVRFGCPCVGRVCLWKCCGDGQAFFNKSCEATDYAVVNPFSPPVFKGKEAIDVTAKRSFFYMYSRLCDDRYLVDPSSPTEEIFIQQVCNCVRTFENCPISESIYPLFN